MLINVLLQAVESWGVLSFCPHTLHLHFGLVCFKSIMTWRNMSCVVLLQKLYLENLELKRDILSFSLQSCVNLTFCFWGIIEFFLLLLNGQNVFCQVTENLIFSSKIKSFHYDGKVNICGTKFEERPLDQTYHPVKIFDEL